MKKINIILAVCVAFVTMGCEFGAVPDEQFDKKVVFTKNGFQDYPLEYNEEGKVVIKLAVSVGGTSDNDKNFTVGYAVDSKILADYNYNRFKNKVTSYFEELPSDCYTFQTENITFEKGKDFALLPIEIDFSKMDPYGRFVLPLVLVDPTAYELDYEDYAIWDPTAGEEGKGDYVKPIRYSMALLNFTMSNFFSGAYTISGDLKVTATTNYTLPLSGGVNLYALDFNTCYTYLGDITIEDEDYAKYIYTISMDKMDEADVPTVENPETGEEERISDDDYYVLSYEALEEDVNLTAPDFDPDPKTGYNYATISKAKIKGEQRYLVTVQMNANYTYTNLSDDSSNNFVGKMILLKNE